MKTSDALKQVKKSLWDGRAPQSFKTSMHICNATNDALHKKKITPEARDAIHAMIHKRLGIKNVGVFSATLEAWLNKRRPEWFQECLNARVRPEQQMQAYRHRWVDALIAEFQAKGD